VHQYYRRHPEAKLAPLDLSSFEPPAARRFAFRQMELVAAGVPRRAAQDQAEAYVAAAAAAASPAGPAPTVVEVVQREEEAQLTEALKRYIDHHGDQPPPAAALPSMQGRAGPGHLRPQHQQQWQRPGFAQQQQERRPVYQQQQQQQPRQPQPQQQRTAPQESSA
jgi:hypothetical protein